MSGSVSELLPLNAPLILIDLQNAIDHPSWGQRNNPEAERNVASFAANVASNSSACLPHPARFIRAEFSLSTRSTWKRLQTGGTATSWRDRHPEKNQ
jgi:hypothetical protein